jgi:hypothetical protein
LIGLVPEFTLTWAKVPEKTNHSPTALGKHSVATETFKYQWCNDIDLERSDRKGRHESVHMSRRLRPLGQLMKCDI